VDADGASRALTETWERLVSVLPGGWTASASGAVAAVTGVALPTLNGVWVGSADTAADVVADLLDRVAATGLPYCLQAQPDAAERLADLAAARGMSPSGEIPLMVLDDADSLGGAPANGGLEIRVLRPAEAELHARVAAAGFTAPEEPFVQLMRPEILAAPGVRCYLGEVDGEPATTGFGVTCGAYVAIFNIATPPPYRGRGFASALTARAIRDGFDDGAKWAWLQTSEAGYKVYKRLGFRTVATWRSWMPDGAGH
jgi:ribosomal protein S18 acetylase RimI-like enzyme